MSDIKLDISHDIAIENNDIVLISSSDEVKQRLLQNLKSFYGDWFLNLTSGVPYYQDIFRKDYDVEVISVILKQTILNTLGVLELLSFELSIDDTARKLSLSFDVRATDKTISISEVILQ